jgi:hypothetical protein
LASSSNRRRATQGDPTAARRHFRGHGITAVTGPSAYDCQVTAGLNAAHPQRPRPYPDKAASRPYPDRQEGGQGDIATDIALRYRGKRILTSPD